MEKNASVPIVLAVSGGVDSVVMLDLAVRQMIFGERKIIVAHFDHGIRDASSETAEFVRELA
ncbi:MAG: tRNA lysidine(34) synthetase TilS, partial [Candidatus Nomurabacteria bacterium]|nr:tRNA lysidine(34) synthetase TilS [Candidatus Nomurabacteria bacterium]